MSSPIDKAQIEYLNQLIPFFQNESTYKFNFNQMKLELIQTDDNKELKIELSEIERIIERIDQDGSRFFQINFVNKRKLLLTKSLIGFKPYYVDGFDITKIPKVVTTVDLKSVILAIEHLLESDEDYINSEIDILKKVFQSILKGAEQIGMCVTEEKRWFSKIMLNHSAGVA